MTFLQMLLSGGVDSTVCAALLRKSLKSDQIRAIHIDNGFMRKGESDQVLESLQKLGLEVKGRKPVNSCSLLHICVLSLWPTSLETLVHSYIIVMRAIASKGQNFKRLG